MFIHNTSVDSLITHKPSDFQLFIQNKAICLNQLAILQAVLFSTVCA